MRTQDNISVRTRSIVDELMSLVGLEEVKSQIINILNRVTIARHQRLDLAKERFNLILQGNPGTGKCDVLGTRIGALMLRFKGKTTVARIYAKFLHSIGILKSKKFLEVSGAELIVEGPEVLQDKIDNLLRLSYYDRDDDSEDDLSPRSRFESSSGGGVLFVDEAYQLTATHTSEIPVGRIVLDLLLSSMEKNIGSLVVVFAGYKKDMQSLLEHNEGLRSRVPFKLDFADFDDSELWTILRDKIRLKYDRKMRIEGGEAGLFMRIAVRRIASGRGSRGFGNARLVENVVARIAERQAKRLIADKRAKRKPNYFLFTKEDLIGLDPADAFSSPAIEQLNNMIGLGTIKTTVTGMVRTLQINYERELHELRALDMSLNRIFFGSPGTGKTTVAKIYGQILAEIGLLSDGEGTCLLTPLTGSGHTLSLGYILNQSLILPP